MRTISLIKFFKKIFFVFISILIFFILISDFILPLFTKNIHSTFFPNKVELDYRMDHTFYHHGIQPNKKVLLKWGYDQNEYIVCSNWLGFKSACNEIEKNKRYDLAFLGDSFVEGIGLIYEDTFAGIIAKQKPNIKTANLGVSSYSSSIYYSKLKYFIEKKKIKFNHIIIAPDISDIQDEALTYKLCNDGRTIAKEYSECIKNELRKKIQNKVSTFVSAYLPNSKIFYFIIKDLLRNFRDFLKNEPKINEKLNIIQHNENFEDRGGWTYNLDSNSYGKLGAKSAIQTTELNMKKIYDLLNKNNIKLSIVVYPWPNQLKNDVEDHLHVKMWREFCVKKCEHFIDANAPFYRYMEKNGFNKTKNHFYMKNDVHFNVNGNKLISDTILKNINLKK
jgi:hypothetical protein